MGPYRSLPEQAPRSADHGFPSCSQQLGLDRFEITFASFRNVYPGAYPELILLGLPAVAFLLAVPRLLVALVLLSIAALALHRTRFVVTRDDAWVEAELFGVRHRRRRLGRRPGIENFGWDWEELAVYPADPALKAGLHDNDRAVLVEWDTGDATRDREGAYLRHVICAEIARLHA